jgi:hypothetical protein
MKRSSWREAGHKKLRGDASWPTIPDEPTAFERFMQTAPTIEQKRAWIKAHKDRNHVPELILDAFGWSTRYE